MQPPRMDLDDRVLHYLLVGVGLGLGSFIKTGWDKLSDRLWDKEGQEFKKWKAQIKDTKK
jgi:hypothetical protein